MASFRTRVLFPPRTDAVVTGFLQALGFSAAIIIALIAFFLLTEVGGIITGAGILSFVLDEGWFPTNGSFNLIPMLLGSLAVTAGAVILAFPVALGCAACLHLFMVDRMQPTFRRLLEILGGIPSVVFGFWGLVVLVPLVSQISQPGAGLFTASVVLAIMILPTAALTIDAAFGSVPQDHLQGVRALGLGSWEVFRLAMIPHAKKGIWTSLLLSSGRAIGETMAVLMVCGNIVQLPGSIFDPIRTLTANIALELGYAEGVHRSALFATGLVLICLISALVLATSLLDGSASEKGAS